MMGGLGILAWIFFRLFGNTASAHPLQAFGGIEILEWCAILLWFPSIASALLPLYSSRASLLRYPISGLLLPGLILLGTLLAAQHPTAFLTVWARVALIWLGCHCAWQTLALCLLYLQRAGLAPDGPSRALLGSFSLLCFLHPALATEVRGGSEMVLLLEVQLPALPLPPWMAGLSLVLLGLTSLAILCWPFYLRYRRGRFPPLLALLPLLTQFLFLVASSESLPAKLLWFTPVHALQYLYIAAWVRLQERHRDGDPSIPHFLGQELLRFAILILVLGLGLFKGLPLLASAFGIPGHLAVPSMLCGVLIQHALVDGVLWKPRRPGVWRILLLPSPGLAQARALDPAAGPAEAR